MRIRWMTAFQNNTDTVTRLFSFFLISILCLAGCKSSKPGSASSGSHAKVQLSESQRADVTYLFFNANKEKILGNLNTAADLFAEVIRKDGSNAAAMYELANIYAEQKKYSDALFFSKSAYRIDPKNSWYALSYSDILQKNKKFIEAADVLAQLVKDNPDHADYYFEWASAMLFADKPQEAIKIYDKLEERTGITKDISMQKARLYQRLNKNDKAIAELQKLIDSNPMDAQSYGMMAEVYQSMGEKQKALDTYQKILDIDPENPYIHLSLADFYRSNGEKEKSVAELKKAFQNKDLDVDTKISILLSYLALIELHPELKEQAMEMCVLLLETHPSEARAHAVYGEFLNQDKKFAEAQTEFRKAKQLGSKEFAVYNRILYLDTQLQTWDSMMTDSEEAMSLFPDQPITYFFSGFAHIQKKKYSEGIAVLNTGVKMVVDNKELEEQFYASLGDAYQELKEYAKSDEQYEKALELNPKDATVLNNYAYYLSVRGEKLDKAEEMSRKSNEIQPNQSSYEDTYGWIMFKQGKYAEAKTWIEKSIQHGSDKSATVLEHYGDVIYKLGDTAKAFEYWQKAKDAGEGGSELLDKKILEKKFYE